MSMRLSRPRERNTMVWLALWTVYVVWGSTYLAIRISVETLPPLLTAGVRFVVAGTIMYAILAARRGLHAMRVTGRQLLSCVLVGAALLLGGNGLVVLAERDVASSLAALIIASVPLWVVVFRWATGDRVSAGTLAGVAVGFAGVAMLVLPSGSGRGGALGLGLLVSAAVCWAAGSFLSTRLVLPADPLLSTTIQMLCGGAWLVAGGIAMGEMATVHVDRFSAASIGAFAYLIVFGSLFAFTAYVWLLQNAPISKVSTYAYVNPVIALLLGWVILSENITVTMLAGAAVIVVSVAFIVRRESGPRRTTSGVPEMTSGSAAREVPVSRR
jgi:drug/metabolite transporter (DMT)-like permease